MKLMMVLAVTVALGSAQTAPVLSNNAERVADRCTGWQANSAHSGIDIMICEYESGGSGYYKFRNRYNKAARISFKITFRNGKSTTGSTNIPAGSETSGSSCFSCAAKNSGVQSWSLEKVKFEGEDGYW